MRAIKIVLLITLTFMFLNAKTDFSTMSTEELVALIGYIKQEEKTSFDFEIRKRVSQMSEEQKKKYEESLKRDR